MSNDKLKLTASQKEKLARWLNDKGRVHSCPVCSTNSWMIADHLTAGVIVSTDGNTHVGGVTYPQAIVVCNNCSYVRTFMAVPIGLTKDDEERSGQGTESEEKSDG